MRPVLTFQTLDRGEELEGDLYLGQGSFQTLDRGEELEGDVHEAGADLRQVHTVHRHHKDACQDRE